MQSPCPERLHACTAGTNALHGCHRRVGGSSAIKYRIGHDSRAAVQAQRAQRLPACLAHNASAMAFLSGHTHQYPGPAPRRSSTTMLSSSLSVRRARFTVSTPTLSLPASSYRSVHLETLGVAIRNEILKFGFVIEDFQVGILETPIQV
jgi:hypothetical protein